MLDTGKRMLEFAQSFTNRLLSVRKLFLFTAAFSLALAPIALRALTDEEKKAAFLKTRGEESPEPASTPKPKPKPKPATRHSPTPHHKATPKPEATPRPKPTPELTPKTPPKLIESDEDAVPKRTPAPPPVTPKPARPPATPKPAPTPSLKKIESTPVPPTDITIAKSGFENEQGYEPPPPPPKFSLWPWSKPVNYHYLTKSVIDAIRKAPVKKGRWQYVVVHNSGTRQGNAKIFDYYHRHTRGMPNGLAYHFVIGNGTSSGNGAVEIGNRWTRQVNGGHVHSDYLNNIAIGICLVGDFNRDTPTKQQLEATEELIRFLRERVGKNNGKICVVKAHRAINPPQWPTDCPGDKFPFSWLRRFD